MSTTPESMQARWNALMDRQSREADDARMQRQATAQMFLEESLAGQPFDGVNSFLVAATNGDPSSSAEAATILADADRLWPGQIAATAWQGSITAIGEVASDHLDLTVEHNIDWRRSIMSVHLKFEWGVFISSDKYVRESSDAFRFRLLESHQRPYGNGPYGDGIDAFEKVKATVISGELAILGFLQEHRSDSPTNNEVVAAYMAAARNHVPTPLEYTPQETE